MISSTANQQVKTIIQLNKKSKARRELRAFVVEGIKMCRETPRELLQRVYVTQQFEASENFQAFLAGNDIDYEVVSDSVFAHMSDTNTPQGILALVRMPEYTFADMINTSNPQLLVLEDIQDPGNLGTMFRTAEGAGISGIIMTKETVDLFGPKTVRATMGSIYRMPYLITEDLHQLLQDLRQAGVRTFAAHLQGKKYYDELNFTAPSAFLIGNEGNGLREETAKLADEYLKIPMEGQLESLNAAMAAGILMYEAHRQRRRMTDREESCVFGSK
ncbi:MAG: RNA methyltransferase [Eubacterium sp.]|nr:RNA methyltransferase [Eubacterium sp.]